MSVVFRLKIYTLEKSVYDDEVMSVVVPGVEGYFGVLAHHARLVAALRPGKVTVKHSRDGEGMYAVSGGFLEVSDNTATLLADAIELASDIDLRRAEAACERAKDRLRSRTADIDYARAQAAFSRAMNRIEIYHSGTSH